MYILNKLYIHAGKNTTKKTTSESTKKPYAHKRFLLQ